MSGPNDPEETADKLEETDEQERASGSSKDIASNDLPEPESDVPENWLDPKPMDPTGR